MKNFFLVALIIVVLGIYSSVYTIDETEQVVITQFGEVIGQPIKTPGIKFRIPFIQHPNYFPKNLLLWDGEPGQIPTHDKTYIWVDTFARWKIVDPISFIQTVNNVESALSRLDDIIDPAVRNLITSNRLIESVRNTNRSMSLLEDDVDVEERAALAEKYRASIGREKITNMVLKQAQPKLTDFGIELVDVKIKRINYVEEVRKSVYGRMIAERNQIAAKFRAEGRGEAQKILGEKEKKVKIIESEAYKKAEEIKGEADALSTKIYADSYGIDPEFYSFVKTLEIYRDSLDSKSSLVLSTDSEFLRFIKSRE